MSDYRLPTDVLKVAPSAGALVVPAFGANNWVAGAWQEITPAIDAPGGALLSTVFWVPGSTAAGVRHQQIDLGVGAAGAEALIASLFYTDVGTFGALSNFGRCEHQLPIALDVLAAGCRVACRRRSNYDLSTVTPKVGIGYLPKPVGGAIESTTQVLKTLPSGAAAPEMTKAGSHWANSAWYQLAAALATDILVVGWGCSIGASSTSPGDYELDFGAGGAGAEVARLTVRGGGVDALNNSPRAFYQLALPYQGFLAGDRVSVRIRGALDVSEAYTYAWLTYLELPL